MYGVMSEANTFACSPGRSRRHPSGRHDPPSPHHARLADARHQTADETREQHDDQAAMKNARTV